MNDNTDGQSAPPNTRKRTRAVKNNSNNHDTPKPIHKHLRTAYLEQRLHAMHQLSTIEYNNSELHAKLASEQNYVLPSIDLLHHINTIASNMLKDNTIQTYHNNNTTQPYTARYECLDSSVCVTMAVLLEEYVNKQVDAMLNND